MTTNLCPCSQLDWSGCDLTAEHHPNCTASESILVSFNGGIGYIALSSEEVDSLTEKGVEFRLHPKDASASDTFNLNLSLPDYEEISIEELEKFNRAIRQALKDLDSFGAVPFDGSIDSVEASSRALTQDELLEMAHKKMAEVDFANDQLAVRRAMAMPHKFYILGHTVTNEWGRVSTFVEFLHCGLKQEITFPDSEGAVSCAKCETVACFPDDFEF
jgi:hypothetical protein